MAADEAASKANSEGTSQTSVSSEKSQQASEAQPKSSPRFFGSHQGQRHFQLRSENQTIGKAAYRWIETEENFILEEESQIKVTMMGMVQRIQTRVALVLDFDRRIQSFDYMLRTGDSEARIKGRRQAGKLRVEKDQANSRQSLDIEVSESIVIGGPMIRLAALSQGLPPAGKEVKEMQVLMFEPSQLAVVPMKVQLRSSSQAGQFDLTLRYEGQEIHNRISRDGNLLEERMMIPPSLPVVATPLEPKAYENLNIVASNFDLVEASRVAFPTIPNPKELRSLKVRVSGVNLNDFNFARHRQSLEGDLLEIRVEEIPDRSAPVQSLVGRNDLSAYLQGDFFIPVQHPDIQRKAREIVGAESDLWKRARRIHDFVYQSLDKRPYISLPDAIETLQSREGDCNEHAVLFTALARAAGVPTRMVIGLVHSNTTMSFGDNSRPVENRPGFYYHAWVEVFNGYEWISMDPTWNQIPAGATHIALIEGSAAEQVKLVGLVGNLELSLVEIQRKSNL